MWFKQIFVFFLSLNLFVSANLLAETFDPSSEQLNHKEDFKQTFETTNFDPDIRMNALRKSYHIVSREKIVEFANGPLGINSAREFERYYSKYPISELILMLSSREDRNIEDFRTILKDCGFECTFDFKCGEGEILTDTLKSFIFLKTNINPKKYALSLQFLRAVMLCLDENIFPVNLLDSEIQIHNQIQEDDLRNLELFRDALQYLSQSNLLDLFNDIKLYLFGYALLETEPEKRMEALCGYKTSEETVLEILSISQQRVDHFVEKILSKFPSVGWCTVFTCLYYRGFRSRTCLKLATGLWF